LDKKNKIIVFFFEEEIGSINSSTHQFIEAFCLSEFQDAERDKRDKSKICV